MFHFVLCPLLISIARPVPGTQLDSGAPGAFPFGETLGRLQLHTGEAEAEAEEAPRMALGSGPSTQAQRSSLKLLFICVCVLYPGAVVWTGLD